MTTAASGRPLNECDVSGDGLFVTVSSTNLRWMRRCGVVIPPARSENKDPDIRWEPDRDRGSSLARASLSSRFVVVDVVVMLSRGVCLALCDRPARAVLEDVEERGGIGEHGHCGGVDVRRHKLDEFALASLLAPAFPPLLSTLLHACSSASSVTCSWTRSTMLGPALRSLRRRSCGVAQDWKRTSAELASK
ncbi:hypothetical protein BV20DRAFT_638750 [Pilatotrama ljubarskyi]|nr:hypothetical protein BV20DRAFT_638750 [Pilatotrama ljubarskyi]